MKKRKLSGQKIFCFISFIFLLVCCLFYGGRFIKLYLENNKNDEDTNNKLVSTIIENSNENMVKKDDTYYFYKNVSNNYVSYSNLKWRIVKIHDNSIVLISDKTLTSIAYKEDSSFENSYVNKWLNSSNEDYSGILENVLNNKESYLIKNDICLDKINDVNKVSCKNINSDYFIGLLSLEDYVNTGAKESFINNGEYFYLSNFNANDKVWYINDDGKVSTSNGTDVIGIRAVITLKPDLNFISGNGTYDDPYVIDSEKGLFGSYVKLDDDIFRIYKIEDNIVKLVLTDYIKVDGKNLEYKYSNTGYYHNDTVSGTIAYYMNKTYLNSLSYNKYIKEVKWSNGILGSENDYDYTKTLSKTVPTKVSLISLGDIILNNENGLNNYFTSTGVTKNSSLVYSITDNANPYGKVSSSALNVVPAIAIDKSLLTKGSGSIDDPYEME